MTLLSRARSLFAGTPRAMSLVDAAYDSLVEQDKTLANDFQIETVGHMRDFFQKRVANPARLQAFEAVNHPPHYGGADNPYEAIKVIEAWGLDFCLGNTVKYIARAGKKDATVQDLKKARWYLDREISNLEATDAKG